MYFNKKLEDVILIKFQMLLQVGFSLNAERESR